MRRPLIQILSVAIGALAFAAVPFAAYASNTHTFVCGDFDTLTHASCSSNVIATVSGIGGWKAQASTAYTSTAGTYYVSFTLVSSSTVGSISVETWNGSANDQNTVISGGSCASGCTLTAHAITISTGGTGFIITDNSQDHTLISGLCITDTSGACEGGGGGGGGGGGAGTAVPCATSSNQFTTTAVQGEVVCQVQGVAVYLVPIVAGIIGILVALLALGIGFYYLIKYTSGGVAWTGGKWTWKINKDE